MLPEHPDLQGKVWLGGGTEARRHSHFNCGGGDGSGGGGGSWHALAPPRSQHSHLIAQMVQQPHRAVPVPHREHLVRDGQPGSAWRGWAGTGRLIAQRAIPQAGLLLKRRLRGVKASALARPLLAPGHLISRASPGNV